jgi:hypothetical protein
MPIEIFDKEEFIELSGNATECRIKKNPDNTKLKLRTPTKLYTIKLDPKDANELVSRLNCSTVEV